MRRVALDFTLELADSGALLERLGMGRVLKRRQGQAGGRRSRWHGLAARARLPEPGRPAEGRDRLRASSSRPTPGAARLLGVLSLQSLPRRLTLDFRDLFERGLRLRHRARRRRIEQGVAATNNLRMSGANAAVLMEGSADLARETQDLHVVVVPEINAGTASLAYAAINPAIGLGTFLAQMFLRKPLIAAGTREFHVEAAGPTRDRSHKRRRRVRARAGPRPRPTPRRA